MKRALVVLASVLLLAGCSTTQPDSTATPWPHTVPEPTRTVAEPAPVPSPTSEALIFEALGEGTANVTWATNGTVVQKEVTLPFKTALTPDSYVAGVVQRMSGSVGCRLTLGSTVVDEKPLQDGQLYAECVLKDF